MANEEKQRYSAEELKEFEAIIRVKLDDTNAELKYLRAALSKKNDTGTDATSGNSKVMEDGADTAEKENLNQLAVRQQKFAVNLENALMRIKNGTYGVCIDSGKLISKERLRLVPHTQHSIEAKLKQKFIQVKEVKFRPGTDDGDYNVKLRNLVRFLEEGDKTKITLRFRGRELAHQEIGVRMLERLKADLEPYGAVEQFPKMEGRQMVMMIGPK